MRCIRFVLLKCVPGPPSRHFRSGYSNRRSSQFCGDRRRSVTRRHTHRFVSDASGVLPWPALLAPASWPEAPKTRTVPCLWRSKGHGWTTPSNGIARALISTMAKSQCSNKRPEIEARPLAAKTKPVRRRPKNLRKVGRTTRQYLHNSHRLRSR